MVREVLGGIFDTIGLVCTYIIYNFAFQKGLSYENEKI